MTAYPPWLRLEIPDGAVLLDGDECQPASEENARALARSIERDLEQFAGLVATTIVDGGWWLDDGAGVPWLKMVRKARRDRIRRAARARKARRGWR